MKAKRLSISVLLVTWLAAGLPAAAEEPWLTSFNEALAQAEATNRYILVDMWARWCGWCYALEEQVFSTPKFQAFAEDFVLLRLDTMDEAEGSALQQVYGVERLPTTVIVDADRVKVGMVTGMYPTAEYIEKLGEEVGKYKRMIAFYEKVRASDKVEIQRQLAEDLHGRGDGLRAAGLYERLQESAKDKSQEAAWLSYYTADAYRVGRDFENARVHVARTREMSDRLGNPQLAEKVDLLDYYIARNSGDCVTAKTSLRAFLERHPTSELRYEARKFLRDLRSGNAEGCEPPAAVETGAP